LTGKYKQTLSSPKLRVNGLIRAREVRLIASDGEQVGILPLQAAIMKAREAGLDLVEVAPTANPPVCRIMDFGKYRYEQSKKDHKIKGHQKTVHLKEIQFRPLIGEHDIEFKVRHAREFLEGNHKVRITLLFRGRELGLQEKGKGIMAQIEQQLSDVSLVETPLKREGRNMMIILAPKAQKSKKATGVKAASKPAADGQQTITETVPKTATN